MGCHYGYCLRAGVGLPQTSCKLIKWQRRISAICCGILLAGCLVFLSHSAANAGYPPPNRVGYHWYTCYSISTEGTTNSFSEPVCSELHWDYDGQWDSEPFNFNVNCQPGTCSEWQRWHIVPADGVTSFTVQCDWNVNIDDNGLGSGSAGGRGETSGGHLAKSGDANYAISGGDGFFGSAGVYTFTHTGGEPAGFSYAGHEPVSSWFITGAGLGGWVQANAATSGNQVSVQHESGCYVDTWDDTSSPGATPTNTPTNTPTPSNTPTITPTPTPTIVDPTGTPTPTPTLPENIPTLVPFPTAAPAALTPAPGITFTWGFTLTDGTCTTVVPGLNVTASMWAAIFAPFLEDWGPGIICVDTWDIEAQVGEFNLGAGMKAALLALMLIATWKVFRG